MTDIRIIPLEKRYLDQTIALAQRCFPAFDPAEASFDFPLSLSEVQSYKPLTFIAIDGETVIGTLQVGIPYLGANTRAIAWLCVDESLRGQGIAKKLMLGAEEWVAKNIFENRPGTLYLSSIIKPEFYEGLGYRHAAPNHGGAFLMQKIVNAN